MARTTLKAKKYYDWQEIKKHFGLKDIHDVFDNIGCNGYLKRIYNPCEYTEEEMSEWDEKTKKIHNNKKRIFDELGECEIHVWW